LRELRFQPSPTIRKAKSKNGLHFLSIFAIFASMALWGWSEEVWGKLAAIEFPLTLRPSLVPGSESFGAAATPEAVPPSTGPSWRS
jgi:hypothetical protein